MALNNIKKISPLSHWSLSLSKGVAIGSMFILAACGDEVTEVTEVTQVVGMQVVDEGDNLPKCNADNEGMMFYSVDSAAAYTCVGKKWVSMKGKDGKDGDNGENGTNGTDGADCKIVSDSNGVTTLKCGDDTTTLYKAMCGVTPYDPTQQYCSVQGILDLKKCGDKMYNPESHLCDARDTSLYRYVTIGTQVWMAENLDYKVDSSFCYKKAAQNCDKYGRLYTWAAAVGKSEKDCGYGKDCSLSDKPRGVCPEGWHLPDSTEWNTLLDAVGGYEIAGKVLKVTFGWGEGGNGTDAYGFSVLPAGTKNIADYDGEGDVAKFWSSLQDEDGNQACAMGLADDYDKASFAYSSKENAYSVRCLKN